MGALRLKREELPHYTYDDYKIWEGRWELIYGIPFAMSPAPSMKHQRVNTRMAALFDAALSDCNKCETYIFIDWKIAGDTIVQPDLSIICGKITNPIYLDFPPELVVEILSLSTRKKDISTKFELYQREQVKYYVVVEPFEQEITVYQLKDGKYEKAGEGDDFKFLFQLGGCDVNFDFGKIWD